jgi:hypothetical protein
VFYVVIEWLPQGGTETDRKLGLGGYERAKETKHSRGRNGTGEWRKGRETEEQGKEVL